MECGGGKGEERPLCARMHGLGHLCVEMLSKHNGNTFHHTNLSPNPNITGRYFHSKLTSKEAGELKRLVFILITKATYEAQKVSARV